MPYGIRAGPGTAATAQRGRRHRRRYRRRPAGQPGRRRQWPHGCHGCRCDRRRVVGDRVDNQNNYQGGVQEQAVKQCRTVDHWESRNTGYEVTYDYRGRNYTSIMSYDPGERIRLRVSIEPAQQRLT
jgi:hypothetical protein